jgi:hypothetical protein
MIVLLLSFFACVKVRKELREKYRREQNGERK